jgi:hypothetical protein
MNESGFIVETGMPLAGFIICYALVCIATLVFVVMEYRRWKLSPWIVAGSVILIMFTSFIWLVVSYAISRKLRNIKVERRFVQLKIALSWFVVIGMFVFNLFCQFFCRRIAGGEWTDELAACCALSCIFGFMIFAIWMNAKLNLFLKTSEK